MIEHCHTDRQLFTAMQVTPENLRYGLDVDGDGTSGEPPMTDWVIAWTGCDGLWGGGNHDCDLAFDDSCGRDWFRGWPYANYGDWLVLGEDGLFFFVPRHVFEILFEVEDSKICRECRYIPEKHEGPGVALQRSGTFHSSDCPSMAWLKPKVSDEPLWRGGGFIDNGPCRHDVIR